MDQSTIKEEIARNLDHLPLDLQRRVLDFARALALSVPKGAPGKDLLRFAGAIQPDDLQLMDEAIEAGCERVDTDGW